MCKPVYTTIIAPHYLDKSHSGILIIRLRNKLEMRSTMKKIMTTLIVAALSPWVAMAQGVPEAKSFNQTDGVLERARAIEDIEYKIMVQRATQTAIYYMPAVVMVDFVKAIRRDLGGDINDVAYLNAPLGSDDGFLTANDVTAYSWASLSSEKGPIVVEVPPATDKVSYFGSILNAWSQPIEDVGPAGRDKGKGGKYLLLPPGYDGKKSNEELEKEGYFVYQTDTYEYGFSFRPRLYNNATDKDAGDYAKGVKIYYLSEADDPPSTRYLDATEKSYDCLPYYNYPFFEDLNHVVQNNPIRPQDKGVYSLLKDLGIEKGKEFKPTERQRKAIHEGLLLAYASMQKYFVTPGKSMEPLWKDENGDPKTQWMFWLFAPGQAEAGFPHETETEVLVDDRAAKYFYVTYLPKYLGGGTFYLTGLFDSDGNKLDGRSPYKLNVPKGTRPRRTSGRSLSTAWKQRISSVTFRGSGSRPAMPTPCRPTRTVPMTFTSPRKHPREKSRTGYRPGRTSSCSSGCMAPRVRISTSRGCLGIW